MAAIPSLSPLVFFFIALFIAPFLHLLPPSYCLQTNSAQVRFIQYIYLCINLLSFFSSDLHTHVSLIIYEAVCFYVSLLLLFLGFGGWRENKIGFNAAELPQQVQPMPPVHGGAGPHAAEPRPSPFRRRSPSQARWLLWPPRHQQVLQLQASWLEMQMWWPLLQPLDISNY